MLAQQQPFLFIPIPNPRMGRRTFILDKCNAKAGLEPDDRNRFGALPNLVQRSLPSSLSRQSAQLKATDGARPGRGNESRSCTGRGNESRSCTGRGNESRLFWFWFWFWLKLKLKLKLKRVPHSRKKRNRALSPNFAKGLVRYPEASPPALAVQGLEPGDRNRFGVLPNLCTKKDRHSNSVARKNASVNVACFRYYQRTPDGLHLRRFAEKLRTRLHWETHNSPRKMAIEQRNHGCPNEIGSFDAKPLAPADSPSQNSIEIGSQRISLH